MAAYPVIVSVLRRDNPNFYLGVVFGRRRGTKENFCARVFGQPRSTMEATHTTAPTPSNFVADVPLSTPTHAPTPSSSLSDGAIVGITLAVVVAVIIILSVIFYLRSAKAAKKLVASEGAPLMGSRQTPSEMDSALGRNGAGSQPPPPPARPTVVSAGSGV